MDLEFITYVRKPFTVEVVEVTMDNIHEVAKLVGTVRTEDGETFIQVNKNKVPHVYRVHPGYFLTRMGKQIRCYNKELFDHQFIAKKEDLQDAIMFLTQAMEFVPDSPAPVTEVGFPQGPIQ